MLILAGLPLMFMELAFGQYASLGPIAIYEKFCPMLHGNSNLNCYMVVNLDVASYMNGIITKFNLPCFS